MRLPQIAILALPALALAADSKKQDAPVSSNNPKRATYQAILQADKPVQGTITGVSNENGTGVNLNINFFSFPSTAEGPFTYHIHLNPVSSDSNCNTTGAHLDPYNATETPACDAKTPAKCQIGDLSGKHGKINDVDKHPAFQTQYLDLYLSSANTSDAFFGNRSVVVHASNGTRLNCANFVLQDGAGSNGTNGGNASYTPTPPPSATGANEAVKTGGAAGGGSSRAAVMQAGVSLGLGAVGVMALVLFF